MPLVYGSYYLLGVFGGIKRDCPKGFRVCLPLFVTKWRTDDFPVIKKNGKTFYYKFKITKEYNTNNGDYALGDPGIEADLIFSRVN